MYLSENKNMKFDKIKREQYKFCVINIFSNRWYAWFILFVILVREEWEGWKDCTREVKWRVSNLSIYYILPLIEGSSVS